MRFWASRSHFEYIVVTIVFENCIVSTVVSAQLARYGRTPREGALLYMSIFLCEPKTMFREQDIYLSPE